MKNLSPLHAELDSLIWAMMFLISSSLIHQIICTDWLDLISLVSIPKYQLSFIAKLNDFKNIKSFFPNFNIYHISRCNNNHSESLAKSTKTQKSISYHVSLTNVTLFRGDSLTVYFIYMELWIKKRNMSETCMLKKDE